MSQDNYRYYRLDEAGRLYGAEWLNAASDEDAIAQVQASYPGDTCEVWRKGRLVAKLSPLRLSA
jgi:hypothetical protein